MNHDAAMVGEARYSRIPKDAYLTIDEHVTQALVDYADDILPLPTDGSIWECAAGAGHMVRVLDRNGYACLSTDIADPNPVDFLRQFVLPRNVSAIITNPPFDLAVDFVRHALDITPYMRPICMLLRNEWDTRGRRIDLFNGGRFSRKIVLTWRPRWKEYEPGDNSPRHPYAWFIWNAGITDQQLVYAERGVA